MKTYDTHNAQTSMSSGRLEPKIPGDERPQTRALDRTVAGIGIWGTIRFWKETRFSRVRIQNGNRTRELGHCFV